MTETEARDKAAKREQHKPKSLAHKRWAAVHDSVRGWHVELIANHAAVLRGAEEKARIAIRHGDLDGFLSAASEALIARCAVALEASPPPSSECMTNRIGGDDE